ncbi:lipopolysaccharide kinase InaA family protein [Azomonas macrocytogenes]|uniref:tRNA A-37 threonylcarbamoyl transferase component Bud32 n=1 Tax=Azomonas macrocytogenes TaxID=69962 RepID=A0A839T6X9_AZOMA|nr:tRNA A-37 threonylcarbamoyl transferase component Bud32 [Azomonas macrocytogenes]
MGKAPTTAGQLLHISPFDQWLTIPGEWVEPPNVKRGGVSGVQRLHCSDGRLLYSKQQTNYCYRSLRHPLGEPTILRENRALLAFAALGIGVPQVVYCGVRLIEKHRDALLITVALEGFDSLKACYERGDQLQWSAALKEHIFRQLGRMLSRLHRARWQHGALYDNHVFLRVRPDQSIELALLDLEKSRRRLSRRLAERHDMSKLRRHSAWGEDEWRWLWQGYRETVTAELETRERTTCAPYSICENSASSHYSASSPSSVLPPQNGTVQLSPSFPPVHPPTGHPSQKPYQRQATKSIHGGW